MRSLRRGGALLAGGLALAVLSGCGSSDSPGVVSDPTPSTSVSISASVTASSSPSATSTLSSEGQAVMDAVDAYYDGLSSAINTGDTSPLKSAVIPECSCASATIAKVDSARAAGQTFRGASWGLTNRRISPVSGGAESVRGNEQLSAYVQVNPDGSEKKFPAGKVYDVNVVVRKVGGTWLVTEVLEN